MFGTLLALPSIKNYNAIQGFVFFTHGEITYEIITANDVVFGRKCSVSSGHAPLSIPTEP